MPASLRVPVAIAGALLLVLAGLPFVGAAVVQYRLVDTEDAPLATVTFDDEKALRVGQERAFVFNLALVEASPNVTAWLSVRPLNESALTVTRAPGPVNLSAGPTTLGVHLHAFADAEPRRYPVDVSVTLLNASATNASARVTHDTYPMNVTISRLPTPLGETGTTLSVGEWVGLAALGTALVGALTAYGVRRRDRAFRPRG